MFTYWYSNTLVESVYLNKGKLDNKMIETMNTDPQRDIKQLNKLTTALQNNLDKW